MAHPVTVQPAPMIPTAFSIPRPGAWSTELCDCCSDMGICVCGTFIPCILACKVAQDYGECCCLPCLPGTLLAIRTGLRERRKIPVSVLSEMGGRTVDEATRRMMAFLMIKDLACQYNFVGRHGKRQF
ncbi:CNFN protein, partial [Polypterus senegalus]